LSSFSSFFSPFLWFITFPFLLLLFLFTFLFFHLMSPLYLSFPSPQFTPICFPSYSS
jgi:hypothetical protein